MPRTTLNDFKWLRRNLGEPDFNGEPGASLLSHDAGSAPVRLFSSWSPAIFLRPTPRNCVPANAHEARAREPQPLTAIDWNASSGFDRAQLSGSSARSAAQREDKEKAPQRTWGGRSPSRRVSKLSTY